MYPVDDDQYQSIVTYLRRDVGRSASNGSFRYPLDIYDRIWETMEPVIFAEWLPLNTRESIDIEDDDNTNKVPQVVLQTAARSLWANVSLSFLSHPDEYSFSLYHIYFHFLEIEELQNGQKREMMIRLKNGNTTQVTLDQNLKPTTIGPLKTTGTNLGFWISTIEGLDLPPILNAFEILRLNELPNNATAPEEVAAMMHIKQIYKVTRNWQGDPCIPSSFSWDGLDCIGDNPPRIISLNLSSSNLTGELPSSLSQLIAIQSLDLSYNELTGSLPDFLAKLPELRVLNLTGNKLTGSVPRALKKKFQIPGSVLSLSENPNLCQLDSCNRKKIIVPIVVSLIFLIILLSALAIFWRNKRKRPELMKSKRGSLNLKPKDRQFSYSEVVNITGNFRKVIGQGGFGKVYHGVLADETQVAVKFLSKSSDQGYKEFRAEAEILMIVHHRNLLSLVGYCDEDEHKALIYEYMANGNLKQHLSGTSENILNWGERLQVAISSAQGLEYLHSGCKPPIIHRDLKPANILLDSKNQAKIGDFGISRAFSESCSYMETNPAGTLGYLDPEYHASGNLNKKSDVYSFGIILLELITGQPAIIRGSESDTSILNWIKPRIGRGDITDIVDPRLQGEFNKNAAWRVVEAAMSCVAQTAIQRPDITNVLAELKEALDIETHLGRNWNGESNRMRLEIASLELSEDMVPHAR